MMPDKMATSQRCRAGVYHFLVLLVTFAISITATTPKPSPADRCPSDYRYRVETCIMEAQVAPQAGGGLPLITHRNKLEELCSRGILQKTIDCLRDIYARCAGNATHRHELDMLFSIDDWRRGRDLLCEDLNLFKDHFDCVSRFSNRISTCILIRTQMFRQAVTQAGAQAHKTLHDITCNFAENIVTCLERPLARACPIQVVEMMTSALHRFLPPACAPVPAVYEVQGHDGSHDEGHDGGHHEAGVDGEGEADEYDTHLHHPQLEPIVFETVIVEGGDAEN